MNEIYTILHNFLDCKDLKFDSANKKSFKQDNAIFTLYAYVQNLSATVNATAFNLSISDINFHSKETSQLYYQNI